MFDKKPLELQQKKLELQKILEDSAKKGDVQKAESASKEYARLFPESPYPHWMIANMHSKSGRYVDAFECYKLAEQALDHLIETKPKYMVFYLKTVVNLISTAITQYVKNQDISLVEKMVAEGYKSGNLYFALGKVSFEKQDYEKTKEWMNKALGDKKMLENLVTDAHIFRGLSNIALNRAGEGEKDLQTAETRAPHKKDIITQSRAEMYESKGLYKESLDALFEQDFGMNNFNPDDLIPN